MDLNLSKEELQKLERLLYFGLVQIKRLHLHSEDIIDELGIGDVEEMIRLRAKIVTQLKKGTIEDEKALINSDLETFNTEIKQAKKDIKVKFKDETS